MKNILYNYYVINSTHRKFRGSCEFDLGAKYSALGLSGEEKKKENKNYKSYV